MWQKFWQGPPPPFGQNPKEQQFFSQETLPNFLCCLATSWYLNLFLWILVGRCLLLKIDELHSRRRHFKIEIMHFSPTTPAMLKSTKSELVCGQKHRNAPSSCSGQARWQRQGDKEGLQQGAATMWVAASQREGCIKTFNWERWIGCLLGSWQLSEYHKCIEKTYITSLSSLICWNTSV